MCSVTNCTSITDESYMQCVWQAHVQCARRGACLPETSLLNSLFILIILFVKNLLLIIKNAVNIV